MRNKRNYYLGSNIKPQIGDKISHHQWGSGIVEAIQPSMKGLAATLEFINSKDGKSYSAYVMDCSLLKPVTEVIFRRFPNDKQNLVALFPAIPGTKNVETCLSFQMRGMHAPANIYLAKITIAAKTDEPDVISLIKVLQRMGYSLKVVKRFTAKHTAARIAAIKCRKG